MLTYSLIPYVSIVFVVVYLPVEQLCSLQVFNDCCRTCLPRDLVGFLDFAFLPNADSFPTQSQVMDYLQAYCKQYGLLQHVKFGHRVDCVSLQENSVGGAGHKWLVEVTDVTNQKVSHDEFDHIFISAE